MRNLMRMVFVVSVLLLILLILAFVLENQQSVALLFLGWAVPELPVSLLILLAMLFGMLIGPTVYWGVRRKAKVTSKRVV